MKIIKIALISFAVIIIACIVAVVILVMTFDINKFKPQIINEANKALHREVDFSTAGLRFSLQNGISVRLRDLVIAEDPAIRAGDFLTAKDIALTVDIMGYLKRKEVNVSNVTLDGVQVTIVRQQDGRLNVESIAAAKDTMAGEAQTPLMLPAILVSSLTMRDCKVKWIDHTTTPVSEIDVSNIGISVDDISFSRPFPFAIHAAILSPRQNVHVTGRVQINMKTGEITVAECQTTTDLENILLADIPVAFPSIDPKVIPENLSGKMDGNLENIVIGPRGMTPFTAKVTLTDGATKLRDVAVPVNNVQMVAKMAQTNVLLEKLSAGIGSGIVAGTGSLEDYASTQVFSAQMNAANLKLEELLLQTGKPVPATGTVSGELQVQGKGFSEPALNSFLTGRGTIMTRNVVLKDINVVRMILDKIAILPNLAARVEAKLPDVYKDRLRQDDTVLQDTQIPFTIANGRILVKEIAVNAEEFKFRGAAQAGFDGSFSLEGTFAIRSDLSQVIAASVEELQYMLDTNKEIVLPVKLSGSQAAGTRVVVDAEYIGKNLLINQGTQQILKILDKNTTSETTPKGTPQPAPTGSAQPAPTTSTQAPVAQEPVGTTQAPTGELSTEAVVSNVLSALFETKDNQ